MRPPLKLQRNSQPDLLIRMSVSCQLHGDLSPINGPHNAYMAWVGRADQSPDGHAECVDRWRPFERPQLFEPCLLHLLAWPHERAIRSPKLPDAKPRDRCDAFEEGESLLRETLVEPISCRGRSSPLRPKVGRGRSEGRKEGEQETRPQLIRSGAWRYLGAQVILSLTSDDSESLRRSWRQGNRVLNPWDRRWKR